MLGRKYSGWSMVIALVFGSASVNRAQSNLLEVTAHDHRITLRFDVQPQKGHETGQEGYLVYSVSFNEKPAFENSALGLELVVTPYQTNEPNRPAEGSVLGLQTGDNLADASAISVSIQVSRRSS